MVTPTLIAGPRLDVLRIVPEKHYNERLQCTQIK